MPDITIQLKATPNEAGFAILAISKGEAKGHNVTFTDAALQAGLHLFDGIPVFIDHAPLLSMGQSVRNLAGTLSDPTWNATESGIQAQLTPAGPSRQVLLDVRDDAKNNPAIMSAVGFSTHLNVQLNAKREVTKLVSIHSVDVVIDPARGGKFLQSLPQEVTGPTVKPANPRAQSTASIAHVESSAQAQRNDANPLTKGGQMKKKVKVQVTDPETNEVSEVEGTVIEPNLQEQQLEANRQTAAQLSAESQRMDDMNAQLTKSNAILAAQCEHLLTSSLSASRLPEVITAELHEQFSGRVFEAAELNEAIAKKRTVVAALTSAGNIQGPGRMNVSGMFNSEDQFRLAVEDMFGVEREEADKKSKVHRLRGIQDAYLMATGDQQYMGGYYPEFALVTANFPSIVANVMNKMLIAAWKDFEQVYGWWKEITTIEHFTHLNDVTWVRTGTIASLPSVAERGEYTELAVGDNKEVTTWSKYGGYVPITIEAVLRDDLRAFTRMPRELALAGIRNISEQIAAIFTQAAGAGPTMNDGGALFNSTAQATAGGHLNLLTTALGTDYTAWNAVAIAQFKKKLMVKNAAGYYGTGKPQGMKPNVCLVPADLIVQAESLFMPRWEAPTHLVPVVGGQTFGGHVKPLAVPEWTDATDWAAVNTLRPGIMLGEIFGVMPQIFSASSEMDPAMFANDESRIKVRQFVTVGVADDMPLSKNNVAG